MWALSENSWSRARYLIALINQGGVTKYGLWRAWFLPHAQPPTAEGLIHPTESHQLWGRCGISWVGFRMHYFKNGRGKTDKKKRQSIARLWVSSSQRLVWYFFTAISWRRGRSFQEKSPAWGTPEVGMGRKQLARGVCHGKRDLRLLRSWIRVLAISPCDHPRYKTHGKCLAAIIAFYQQSGLGHLFKLVRCGLLITTN